MKKNISQENSKSSSKAKKIISRTITVILTAAFLFAIICLGYVCIQTMQGKETNLFGYRLFYVITDSMSPTIEQNEMILSKLIKNTDDYKAVDKQINVGDVVTFTQNFEGKIINNTHRVIKDVYFDVGKNCYCIVTKGDNPNATIDAPVPIANLQAVMVSKVTSLAEIYNFLGSTGGIACMILIPMALMLVSLVYQLVIKIKRPAETEQAVPLISDEEKERLRLEREKEIAEKAVEEYKALEAKKKEIADKAIEEYLKNHPEKK